MGDALGGPFEFSPAASTEIPVTTLRPDAEYEPTYGQRTGLMLEFDFGAVRLRSWGGELLVETIQ